MKILVDINHPGQIHLFKHAVRKWECRGHQAMMVVRDKDVTVQLAKAYGLRFAMGTTRKPGMVNLLKELFIKTSLLLKIATEFKPDVFLSLGSPPAAWAATLAGVPHIAFDDTEHSIEQYWLYAPFTRAICTPACFTRDFGVKQVRYQGYHELAYLHPARFKPDPTVLSLLGLKESDIFFVVRFVSWSATHDVGQKGFSYHGKRRLVEELSNHGRVLITSESPLPPEFEEFRFTVSPHHIHDLLNYSTLYIGEGATMASEAAVLGVPSIYVNSITAGTIQEQEKYGLLHHIPNESAAIKLAVELAEDRSAQYEYQKRRQRLLDDKIDVTAWMVDFVERHGRK